MVSASWNGKEIAASDDCVVVERNQYFPADSVIRECLSESNTQTICPWKGTAHYYNVVDGKTNKDAAWYYPEPKEAAANIKDRIAFWKGVEVRA